MRLVTTPTKKQPQWHQPGCFVQALWCHTILIIRPNPGKNPLIIGGQNGATLSPQTGILQDYSPAVENHVWIIS
jgi:hypothetical protein